MYILRKGYIKGKGMKKKIVALITMLAMMLAMMPAYANAADAVSFISFAGGMQETISGIECTKSGGGIYNVTKPGKARIDIKACFDEEVIEYVIKSATVSGSLNNCVYNTVVGSYKPDAEGNVSIDFNVESGKSYIVTCITKEEPLVMYTGDLKLISVSGIDNKHNYDVVVCKSTGKATLVFENATNVPMRKVTVYSAKNKRPLFFNDFTTKEQSFYMDSSGRVTVEIDMESGWSYAVIANNDPNQISWNSYMKLSDISVPGETSAEYTIFNTFYEGPVSFKVTSNCDRKLKEVTVRTTSGVVVGTYPAAPDGTAEVSFNIEEDMSYQLSATYIPNMAGTISYKGDTIVSVISGNVVQPDDPEEMIFFKEKTTFVLEVKSKDGTPWKSMTVFADGEPIDSFNPVAPGTFRVTFDADPAVAYSLDRTTGSRSTKYWVEREGRLAINLVSGEDIVEEGEWYTKTGAGTSRYDVSYPGTDKKLKAVMVVSGDAPACLNGGAASTVVGTFYADENGIAHPSFYGKTGTVYLFKPVFSEFAKDNVTSSTKITSSVAAKKSTYVTIKPNMKGDISPAVLKDLGYTVKYKYYRSTKKSSGYKLKKTSVSTKFKDTSVRKGKTYYYKTVVTVYKGSKLITKNSLSKSTAVKVRVPR